MLKYGLYYDKHHLVGTNSHDMSDYEAMDYRDGGVGDSDDGMSMNDSEMDRVRFFFEVKKLLLIFSSVYLSFYSIISKKWYVQYFISLLLKIYLHLQFIPWTMNI